MFYRWVISALAGASASTASAQWSVVSLQPSGSYASAVTGITGTQQFGWWEPTASTGPYPVIWNGNATSLVNLLPSGIGAGALAGGNTETQFGFVTHPVATGGGASLWHGTPESRIDLDPTGTGVSDVLAAAANQQVG